MISIPAGLLTEWFDMSNTAAQSGKETNVADRRNHCRQKVLFSCAELGHNNGGTILDISEGGLALQVVSELNEDALPQMRFQFSRAHGWIDTKGRIVWRGDSKRTAGVEFIDLPGKARDQIKRWIALVNDAGFEEKSVQFRNSGATFGGRTVTQSKDAVLVPGAEKPNRGAEESIHRSVAETSDVFGVAKSTVPQVAWEKIWVAPAIETGPLKHSEIGNYQPALSELAIQDNRAVAFEEFSTNVAGLSLFPTKAKSDQPPTNHEVAHDLLKDHSRIGLFVVVVLLPLTFGFFGFALRRAVNRHLNGEAEVKASTMMPSAPANTPINSVSASPNIEISTDVSGFVLQVGAMKAEKNAVSLANVLRQKNLHVFVAKSADDSFYRVLVGPYSEATSAANGEAELKEQGFQAIRKKNQPAQ